MLIRRGLKGFQGPVLPRGVGSTLSCDTNPSLGPWHVSTQIWGFLEFPALGSPPTPHLSWLWASSGFLSWAHHMLPPYRSRFIYYYFFKFNSQPPQSGTRALRPRPGPRSEDAASAKTCRFPAPPSTFCLIVKGKTLIGLQK